MREIPNPDGSMPETAPRHQPTLPRLVCVGLALFVAAALQACGGGSEGPASAQPGTSLSADVATGVASRQDALAIAANASTSESAWIVCSSEYQTCRFPGTRLVRYGANGLYVYGSFTNSVSCGNGVFGDPVPSVVKRCEVWGPASVIAPYVTPPATALPPSVGAVPPGSPPVLSIAGMRSDMVGSHESTVVGVAPEWSWGRGPDPGFGLSGYPVSWVSPAYTMWGLLAASTSGSPATNARVQIRHLRADIKRAGAWTRVQSERLAIDGSNYTDFSINASVPADVRQLGSEGVSVKVAPTGASYHFYPSFRVPYPSNPQALVVSMDVRLVLDRPDGVDDLDTARLYAVAAGDLYQSMDARWDGTNPVNGHAPIGRFRQVGREWRTITAHLGLVTDQDFSEYISWVATQP